MYTYSDLLKQARLSNLLDMNEFAFFFVILFSNNPFWARIPHETIHFGYFFLMQGNSKDPKLGFAIASQLTRDSCCQTIKGPKTDENLSAVICCCQT